MYWSKDYLKISSFIFLYVGEIWGILAHLGTFIVIWMKFGGFLQMLVDYGKPLRLVSL